MRMWDRVVGGNAPEVGLAVMGAVVILAGVAMAGIRAWVGMG